MELVRRALESDADPDGINRNGFTPLHAAAFKGNRTHLRVCLDYVTQSWNLNHALNNLIRTESPPNPSLERKVLRVLKMTNLHFMLLHGFVT